MARCNATIVMGVRTFTCDQEEHGDETIHHSMVNGVRELVWWNHALKHIREIGSQLAPVRPAPRLQPALRDEVRIVFSREEAERVYASAAHYEMNVTRFGKPGRVNDHVAASALDKLAAALNKPRGE